MSSVLAKELAQHVFNHDKHYWALVQWLKRKNKGAFDLAEILAEGSTVASKLWEMYQSDTRPDYSEQRAAALIDSALPKWVEVSERLPENGQRVIAAMPTWKVDGTWWEYILETATFKDGEFLFEGDTPESEDVTHWQPETIHPAAPSTDEKEGR